VIFPALSPPTLLKVDAMVAFVVVNRPIKSIHRAESFDGGVLGKLIAMVDTVT
jgi:hypothetical protein